MTTPIRTSAADANYLSCSSNVWGLNEGTDHAQVLPGQPNPFVLTPTDPQSYSSILKVCDGTHDLTLTAAGGDFTQIPQGMENAVDINNRVTNVSISAEFGFGGGTGDQVITVKGGSHDIKLWGIIYSTGRNAQVVVGAWSDQSHDISYNLDFSGLVNANGQPVTFVLARCSSVKLPPDAKVKRLLSWGYSIYWWAKFAAVKVGIIKGVKS